MSTKTPNYNLVKPADNETADIQVINGNMDIIDTKIKENAEAAQTALKSHLAEITAHGEVLSLYRLNKDANGIYTELQYKRPDGTLAKKSVLSGETSPKYTTRTVTYYKADGITVALTKTYTLTYSEDDLTSEVLQ